MKALNILVGCEKSQEVCKAFRARGHKAFSCDLLPCSGGHPEWHLQMDVLDAIKLKKWHMGIFFLDCTYLTVSNTYLTRGCSKYTKEEAVILVNKAELFFMKLVSAPIDKIAIENPIGRMSTKYRKPNQIIQPYNFGEDASKSTCLWLKGLPRLNGTKYIKPRIVNGKNRWANQTDSGQNKLGPSETRGEERAKTYGGIAKAMASQWG